MYIICGLGNPGKEYEMTRHNVGFMTMDVLSSRLSIDIRKLKFKALIGEGFVGTKKVVLVKPQTYMNLSGEALREIVNYYGASPEELLVVYDDIDTSVGSLRIRAKGSAGTHNGMRSIIYQLQFDNFPRVRIGIGDHGLIPLDKFVLGKFSSDEQPDIIKAIDNAASACEMFISSGGDISAVMNKFNTPKPKKEKPLKETDEEKTAEAEHGKTD